MFFLFPNNGFFQATCAGKLHFSIFLLIKLRNLGWIWVSQPNTPNNLVGKTRKLNRYWKKNDRLLNKLWFEIPKIQCTPVFLGRSSAPYLLQCTPRLRATISIIILYSTVQDCTLNYLILYIQFQLKHNFFYTRPQYTVRMCSILNFLYSIF